MPLAAIAMPPAAAAPALPAPQATTAVRAAGAIKLDGRLDEPDWLRATPLDRFFETYPGERAPAPEHTMVRLLYDDRFLYVGFRLDLKERDRLRTPFVRRDKVGASHDYVQIYLDPQGSRRGSYIFRVNARGVRTDGYQNEVRQSETLDPDYDWDVATRADPGGWTAELRIPLSTLRISRAGAQVWAVVVTRGVPRAQNTQMATAPFPHDASCFLCYAGQVAFADLKPNAVRLLVTPSITVTGARNAGPGGSSSSRRADFSLDAKWLPYDGAAVDLTIHPDFSQVEADQALLTANQRFALSLPEKRPFFREGADLIATPVPVIYTRSVAAPDHGLRFTQRGGGLEATAFAAHDGGRPAIIEPGLLGSSLVLPDFDSDDVFLRLRRGLASGDVGGLAVAKLNDDGSRNVLGGIDASHATSRDRISAQALVSDTRDPDRPDLNADWTGQRLAGSAALLEWGHTGATVWTVRYQRFSSGFRSWLGYVPRVGYQEEYAMVQRPFYSRARLLNTIEPYLSLQALQATRPGAGAEHDTTLGLILAGYKNLAVDLSYHPDSRVLDGGGVERRTRYAAWSASLNPAARIPLVSVTGQAGRMVDYADNTVVSGSSLSVRAVARPRDRIELEARREANVLGGGNGQPRRLKETIRQVIATYYFGPAFYVLLNVQTYLGVRRYPTVEQDRQDAASLQFNWQVRSDLQAYWGVRSSRSQAGSADDKARSTELYFKLSRTLRP